MKEQGGVPAAVIEGLSSSIRVDSCEIAEVIVGRESFVLREFFTEEDHVLPDLPRGLIQVDLPHDASSTQAARLAQDAIDAAQSAQASRDHIKKIVLLVLLSGAMLLAGASIHATIIRLWPPAPSVSQTLAMMPKWRASRVLSQAVLIRIDIPGGAPLFSEIAVGGSLPDGEKIISVNPSTQTYVTPRSEVRIRPD